MTRILTFTTLYPNAVKPNHGIFVENRLRHTLALGGLDAMVVAPVPFFPPHLPPVIKTYADYAKVPLEEKRHGLRVLHPRYLLFPKIGMPWVADALFRCALKTVTKLNRAGIWFDVIDAHYLFPDGVAASRLGSALNLPVVVTGRGSDITQIAKIPSVRPKILKALENVRAIITVSKSLKEELAGLGVCEQRISVLRNGVDLDLFQPHSDAAGEFSGQGFFRLLSVGSLIKRKGHHLIIEALAKLPTCSLQIVGEGPLRARLEKLAQRLGVADRVRFTGSVSHTELSGIYSGADLLVLASAREGWPNVLLEALACGTPVLATPVDGANELIAADAAGSLLKDRTVGAIVEGVEKLKTSMPDREEARRFAERYGWGEVAAQYKEILLEVADAAA